MTGLKRPMVKMQSAVDVLTKEFDKGRGEHKEQCIFFTGLCAWKVAQMICRELGMKNLDEVDEPAPRRTVAEI